MSARRIALEVLGRVFREEAWIRPLLDHALEQSGLSRADRAFAADLCYGVARWRGRVDHAIDALARRGIASIDAGTLDVLRLGVYQLLFTRVKPHAAVHESVALARAHGGEPASRFVNGVLRSLIRGGGPPPLPDPQRSPVDHLMVRESFPRWLVERLVGEHGFEAAARLLAAYNEVPPLTVRVNRRRASRAEVAERLAAEGARTTETRFAPFGLWVEDLGDVAGSASFAAGLFTVQDEASQVVSELVAAEGGRVLDACAAPGGKATALAERLPAVTVEATDVHPAKLRLVSEAAGRLGLMNLRTRVADAAGPLPEAPPEGYAAALVDAPCTGLGVLRRHPEAKWRASAERIPEAAARQRKILANVARHVAPGGEIVYSVCTFTREETDEVIAEFLAAHPEFALEPPEGPALAPLFDAGGLLRVGPLENRMDGFFAARLRRRSP